MKKILSVLLVLVLIASLFVACDNNQQETGADLDKAVEYLATTYKGAEGKETSNDYELIPQISIDGVSYTVTWTVDNANIKITKNETSGFYVVDLPANNEEKCEYTLTATITAPDGTTATKTMKRVLPVLSNVEGVVTEPVANTAYKLFFDQKSVGKVLFLTAETSGNYIKTVVDPKAAADFSVEAAEGGFRVYTLVNGAKSYIKATTVPKEDGKVSKVIGFDTTGSVFMYNAEINAWYTTIDGVNYTMGTYGTYETVSISEDSYYTPENTGVSQFPVQFIEKAAGEAMAPSVGPAEPTELTPIADAVAKGLAMAHNTFTVEKYLVKGTVVEVVNTVYGNLYIEDAEGNKIYVYGLYNEDGSVRFDALATQPKVGDVLTVMGVIGQYNDAAQIKNGWIKKLDAVVCEHTYSAACDATCNKCGATRTAEAHVYDNACDADCNNCAEARDVEGHKYDNVCDADCNTCGTERDVEGHKYDNACDADCNTCGTAREVEGHKYDSACDADCNTCGTEREVGEHVYNNACDADCNVCGAEREVEAHVYDNACDAACNVCAAEREVAAHVYANACDADCDVCGAERSVADHVYDNACDTDCNECGEKREAAAHTYANNCDADCNVCGAKREVSHSTSGACDVECNECGAEVEATADHKYAAECDKTCDVCGAARPVDCKDADDDGKCDYCGKVVDIATIEKDHIDYEAAKIKFNDVHSSAEVTLPAIEFTDVTVTWKADNADVVAIKDGKITFTAGAADATVTLTATFVCGATTEEKTFTVKVTVHTYDNACDADCNVCQEKRTAADHVYDNACDADCNVCSAKRTVEDHKYDNGCDKDCNVCGAERNVEGHNYENDCATKCTKCGFEREVGAHKYTNCDDVTCDSCGATRTAPGHVYDNACDGTCANCNVTRTPADHVYSNACDADCNECGMKREPAAHVYDNCADAACNVCDAPRTAGTCADANSDEKCDVCGAEMSTFPKVGVAYKWYLTQNNLGKILYFKGAMDGYYFATTENSAEAVDIYFEKVDGGYNMYFELDGAKKYIAVINTGSHYNVVFDQSPSLFVYNAELNTMVTDVEENGSKPAGTLYIGTYNTYKTFSASTLDKAPTSFVSQFTEEAIDSTECNHNYKDATCTAGKTCTICGNVDGNALGHTEANAEGKCDRCGATIVAQGDTLSIADAIAMGSAMAHDTFTSEKYYVVGEITEIYNTQYGNMRVKDAAGNILTIYGTYSADGSQRFDAMSAKPEVGATIKLYGIIGQFNDTPQMKNAWIIEFSGHTHSYSDATCTAPATCSCGATQGDALGHKFTDGTCTVCGESANATVLVLDMMGSTNVVSITADKSIYTANGVTYTNDKASSTTNNSNYSPTQYAARAYKGSTIKIEANNITKIVITLDDYQSGQYLPGFDNMEVEGATITRANDVVTIVFDAPVNVFQSGELTAQARIETIEVYVG